MSAGEHGLVDRVVRLERQLRYWQLGVLALLSGLGIVVATGAAAPVTERLDVRELRIVDKEGQPRLLLMTSHLGHAKVMIIDPDGLPRMQLNAEGLSFEERGRRKAWLSLSSVDFYDDDGRRMKLGQGAAP